MPATWNDSFLVGVTEIDRQHQELFAIMDAIGSSPVGEDVTAAFEQLRVYMVEHLAFEEDLMVAHAFPRTREHQLEHQQFAKLHRTVIGDRQDDKARKAASLLIAKWFVTHVTGEQSDKMLGRHLSSCGLQ